MTTKIMRRWDWALPSAPAQREVLARIPDGWREQPRATRKPPILFVHGVAHGAWCFDEYWLPATAERGFPAYAVSLRGHGGSEGRSVLPRTLMRDYVHDIMQTITELPEPPVLVGHSMGSVLAQLVAERYPVRGLALLTPPSILGSWSALAMMARERPAAAAATLIGRTIPMSAETLFPSAPPALAAAWMARLGPESPLAQYELLRRRRLGPIDAPVLVLGAERDALVPVREVRTTAAVHGVRPVLMRGMGHDLMLDAGWDRALGVLLDWVEAECMPASARA